MPITNSLSLTSLSPKSPSSRTQSFIIPTSPTSTRHSQFIEQINILTALTNSPILNHCQILTTLLKLKLQTPNLTSSSSQSHLQQHYNTLIQLYNKYETLSNLQLTILTNKLHKTHPSPYSSNTTYIYSSDKTSLNNEYKTLINTTSQILNLFQDITNHISNCITSPLSPQQNINSTSYNTFGIIKRKHVKSKKLNIIKSILCVIVIFAICIMIIIKFK